MTQLDVLLLVAKRLNQLEIAYMLTGAYGISFYGKPRTTHDIDLKVEIGYYDTEKIYEAFKDDFYVSKEMIKNAVIHRTMFNLIHNETQTKVDFWMVKKTEFDKERFGRRIKVEIHDIPVFIATAEDMIIIKLDWFKESGVQKHYEDALGIIEIQKGKLDLDYLEKWCKKHSTKDLLEKLVSETS